MLSLPRSLSSRTLLHTPGRILFSSLAAFLSTGALLQMDAGAALAWDPVMANGVIDGGTGTWDTTTPNWTADSGATNTTWDSSIASFAGATAGTVTINNGTTGVSATGLTFDAATDATTYNVTSATATNLLTLTGAGSIAANVNAGLDAVLGGTVGFTKSGAGTLTMGGTFSNVYTGTAAITAGTLQLSRTGATAITGPLSITGGTVLVSASEQIANTSAIALNTGGVLAIGNGAAAATETVGAITQAGTGRVSIAQLGKLITTGNSTFNLAGAVVVDLTQGASAGQQAVLQLGGDLAFTGTNATTTTIGISGAGTIRAQVDLGGAIRTIDVANGAAAEDVTLSAQIINGGLIKTGAGTLSLTTIGGSTFTGGVRIDNGVVISKANPNGNNVGTGTLNLNGGQFAPRYSGSSSNGTVGQFSNTPVTVTANSSLSVANGGSQTGNTVAFKTLNLGAFSLTVSSANAYKASFGAVTLSGNGTINTVNTSTAAEVTFTSTVGESGGSRSLTKDGVGTLTLSGVSSYTGGTIVTGGGTLAVGVSGTLGSGMTTVTPTATANTILQLNNFTALDDAGTLSLGVNGSFFGLANLNFSGSETVGSLFLGGVAQAPGTYNATTNASYFSGTGNLVVVPEPATFVSLLGGLGLLLGRRRRQRL